VGVVVSATAAGVSLVSSVGAAVDSATGLPSWGTVEDTVEGSSLAGTTGLVSVAPGLTASFLPKKLPNMEVLLFALAVDAGVVPAAVAELSSAAVTGTVPVIISSTGPLEAPAASVSGAPITRAAMLF